MSNILGMFFAPAMQLAKLAFSFRPPKQQISLKPMKALGIEIDSIANRPEELEYDPNRVVATTSMSPIYVS